MSAPFLGLKNANGRASLSTFTFRRDDILANATSGVLIDGCVVRLDAFASSAKIKVARATQVVDRRRLLVVLVLMVSDILAIFDINQQRRVRERTTDGQTHENDIGPTRRCCDQSATKTICRRFRLTDRPHRQISLPSGRILSLLVDFPLTCCNLPLPLLAEWLMTNLLTAVHSADKISRRTRRCRCT